MNKKELWLKLTSYQFDHLVPVHLWDAILEKFGREHASVKAFADKLSRKLNWEKDFALRALWEYKKFVYLGVISDFSVTPSQIIDQVWHEHLLFSAGYRKFCKEIIQYDFDHNPELVPVSSQTEVFQTQYFDTIALYEREFGSPPPADIWNTTKFTDRNEVEKRIKKQQSATSPDGNDGSSDSLISMFPSADSGDFEFGGGAFGGAGASGSWDDGSGDSSDSGSNSDSGTSCSSSCGGCGGGD